MSSCMYFPAGTSLQAKRDHCRPQVYRYRYPTLCDGARPHEEERGLRLPRARGLPGRQAHLRQRQRVDRARHARCLRHPRHAQLPRRSTAGSRRPPAVHGARQLLGGTAVEDGSEGDGLRRRQPQRRSGREARRPDLARRRQARRAARRALPRQRPPHGTRRGRHGHDLRLVPGHRLRPRSRAERVAAAADRHRRARGRRLSAGATCATGADNRQGNGGVHFYRSDRLFTSGPPPTAQQAWNSYASTPQGGKAIYRATPRTGVEATTCTAHVFQQIPGQNRIFMAGTRRARR